MKQMLVLRLVLEKFCNASGLKVSVAKTTIYFSDNVGASERRQISGSFGFKEVTELGRYLGVPIVHKRVTSSTYQFLVQKVRDKLSRWCASTLTLAGRVVLAKAVLAAIPSYTMQAVFLPKKVLIEIESLIQRFIWGHFSGNRGAHLLSWHDLCQPLDKGGIGFKDLSVQNEAFFMKIAYHLLTKNNNLWVRLMREKYKWFDITTRPMARAGCSRLWHGVCLIWEDLRKCVTWQVGDGNHSRLWKDNWLRGVGPLLENVLPSHFVANMDARVVDMVDVSGNWNFAGFGHLLPMDLQLKIAAIRPPGQGLTDRVLWTHTEKGRFQVRSAYEVRTGVRFGPTEAVWAVVNRFRGLPKIRTFLWLVCHSRILTNAERFRRHMTNDNSCPLCGSPVKDIDHMLQRCPVAISVWSQFVRSAYLVEFLDMELKQWIHVNLTDARKYIATHVDWDILFGSIVWNIWLRRNDFVFNGYSGRRESIDQVSLRCQQECIQHMGGALRSNVTGRRANRPGIRWRKPPVEWWKLNSDGSTVAGSGLSSCGGVVRDADGKWLIGFARRIGICTVVEAKLWGVYEGMLSAWSIGCVKLIIEVDNAVVVDLVRNYNCGESTFSLVSHIVTFMNRSWQVEITHVLREGNGLADSMAKIAGVDDFICCRYLSSPDLVLQQLEEEREGTPLDTG
ncbi:hypothetical protein GQ457_07G003110 [Hibiscus cannabinus]